MATKKKNETPEVGQEAVQEVAKKEKVKAAPQMVTVNGDKVSNAHLFKSNTGEDWFFTAKINDVPLKAKICSPEDCEAIMTKTANIEQLMQKYYPTKVMPRLSNDELKVPFKLMGNGGQEITVHKFNAYKEKNPESPQYGKYKFYAQVGDQKMSALATPEQLEHYFDRVKAPAQMVSQIFGEQLNLKAHYEQFQLPEGVDAKNFRIQKNNESNRYEITAKIEDLKASKELSYHDRVSYFSTKSASKEQLAAKYFSKEIPEMLSTVANAKKNEMKQQVPTLGI